MSTQTTNAITAIKKIQEETIKNVLDRVTIMQEAGELKLPNDYHAGNALKSAWLHLQEVHTRDEKPVLEECTKESICNALLEMVIKGLSVSRHQCYFIPYGKKLTCTIDYRGNLMIAKRDAEVKEVNANIIYEGDNFIFEVDNESGRRKLVKHEQKLENINNDKIRGAYAIVQFNDGTTGLEVMTMPQIMKSWQQGAANGASPAHKNFADQMAKKTVMNRALKVIIGASDDSAITADEPDHSTQAAVKREIQENAHVEEVGFEEIPSEETSVPVQQPVPTQTRAPFLEDEV